ncbi:MAG: hypothetical protein D6761_01150 [Candidatus Dadabacteria bacterium]|nr:MAG: hypothetical protein D6761_01150 [Candidatus Dadabacteria bacterium]
MVDPGQFDHGHHPEEIASRLDAAQRPSLVGDAVLGALDGSVTTLALMAGIIGADLDSTSVLIVGVAKLLADAVSMAMGNYQRAHSDSIALEAVRRNEERHVQEHPEGEREEIRQIFAAKGFTGAVLDQIVDTITADKHRWIETMLTEEWGLSANPPHPLRSAAATFVAFVLAGTAPLIPFALSLALQTQIVWSIALACVAFAVIGAWRARLYRESPWTGAVGTLLTGLSAAAIAWGIAELLKRSFGEAAL